MKAKDYNGIIKIYNRIPKSYGNIIGGFDLLSDEKLEEFGFYNVVVPTYDSRIKNLGDIYFDIDNNVFTYSLESKTWSESLSDLKESQIDNLRKIYNEELSKTDWYITRKIEKGVDIPAEIQTERDNLRADYNSHKESINSKTTKAQVISYDFPSI